MSQAVSRDLIEIRKSLDRESGIKGWFVNGKYLMPSVRVAGQYVSFREDQLRFMHKLTQNPSDIAAAEKAAGWEKGHSQKFFKTERWARYVEKIMALQSVQNGDIKSEWWGFMLDGMQGKKERYLGQCAACQKKYDLHAAVAESYRTDAGDLEMACRQCGGAVALERKEEIFKPSREQVACAVEVGARVEPKAERIHHSFSEEKFSFVLDGEAEEAKPMTGPEEAA